MMSLGAMSSKSYFVVFLKTRLPAKIGENEANFTYSALTGRVIEQAGLWGQSAHHSIPVTRGW